MNSAFLLLFTFFSIFLFIIFTLICGNIKCFRTTPVGKFYILLTNTIPDFFVTKFKKIFKIKDDDEGESCAGKGAPCRYFVIIFFALMYAALVIDYFYCTYPHLHFFYKNFLKLHKIFAFIFPSVPWIIVLVLQFIDPGEITEYNVENYLKKYKYDHVLYNEKICPTQHIPVVPRSRYCRYTQKRVAKYDHYCPWVLAAIGEKTHRWFLFFLVSCVVASVYYCIDDCMMIKFHLYLMLQRLPKEYLLKYSKKQLYFAIILKTEKYNFCCALMFLVIILSLFVFIIQQIFNISQNKTQIELDKYNAERQKRKENGDRTPIRNFYDKGIIVNWLEFLFPSSVPKNSEPWKPDEYWKAIMTRDLTIIGKEKEKTTPKPQPKAKKLNAKHQKKKKD